MPLELDYICVFVVKFPTPSHMHRRYTHALTPAFVGVFSHPVQLLHSLIILAEVMDGQAGFPPTLGCLLKA